MLDENGKINLNLADVTLLTAFLKALGEDEGAARQMAGAIVDWRDEDSLLQPGGGAKRRTTRRRVAVWPAQQAL